ncbi:MAG TPA: BTAD domain-containing putative transcriptional regulator [Anaerolineaceae bacterium]
MRQQESTSQHSDGCEEAFAGPLFLDLLGTFRLRLESQPVGGFAYARLQRLLAYLALHRAAPVSRQQLAFHFWPDSTDQQALKNLRTLLTRLRHAFPQADQWISISAQIIAWRRDALFTLDVTTFETAVARAAAAEKANDPATARQALERATAVYAGDLLPGCYAEWILPLREWFQIAFGDALERLVRMLDEQREYSSALPHARRLLNHDPLNEAAYHHLIRLHLALSDRTEALRACQAGETMLKREFGSEAARTMRDLYARLLQSEAPSALPAMQPPVESGSSSLPLVGRSAEAGIGKTRLVDEGNPLFVVEIVKAGLASQKEDADRSLAKREPIEKITGEGITNFSAAVPILPIPATFPPKVRAVIQWRLWQASPAAQALAQTAAVIGRKFNVEVLARVSDQDAQAVTAGLDELWQRYLVRAQGSEVYDFTHDGIRAQKVEASLVDQMELA